MDSFIDIAGVRARYRRVGDGAPVLVLHGWGGRIETVHPIVSALAARFTVLAPDLPGFGESALPPDAWGASEYTRWTVELLGALELERVSVVAHSNGGRIAICLASRHPERVEKLILVDSAGIRSKRGPGYYRKVYTAKAAKHLARRLGSPGRRLHERVTARVGSADYATAGPLRPTFVKLVNEDLTGLLEDIAAPTLLVWGEHDEATPLADARTMERLIPDAGLVIFPGAGHYSYLDQPERFARVADYFLRPPVPAR